MKHYVYTKSHYMIQMTLPGIFTLLIGTYGIYELLRNQNIFFGFILIVCIYNVWNVFVSVSNPSEIIIDEDNITFCAFSKKHTYQLNDIKEFSMRALAGNNKIYMTIDKGGILKGRYWVRTSEFNDGKELTDFFYDLDAKVNPDSVFTTARRQGRERLKKSEK